MKVVLFCGGLGMRIREAGENVPKPMVTIGYRPILWHLMKYYAHFGHKDFVLCLGHRGDVINARGQAPWEVWDAWVDPPAYAGVCA
jgi:glucose-1-phosphate cytidylyltransferase